MGVTGITKSGGIEITRGSKDGRITVSGQGIEIRRENKPIIHEERGAGFVYLLIDCSGSMADYDKFNQAKEGALGFARDALAKGYLVGLIKFATLAEHLCEPQQKISTLQSYLMELETGLTTNMTAAIKMADQKLAEKTGARVMVIITDCFPNSKTGTLNAATQAKIKGIDIMTIGTDDTDEDFLKKLASRQELGVKVQREYLKETITMAATNLPLLGSGSAVKKGG
jgi:Mg-chelatase subunit ChlD